MSTVSSLKDVEGSPLREDPIVGVGRVKVSTQGVQCHKPVVDK